HESRGSHASYPRKKPATSCAFSKSGYRFCVRMRLGQERALLPFVPCRREQRPFMPRDKDKDNDSRGRRDRPSGGKGRSGAARGPEKKLAKRGFGKDDGGKRRFGGDRDDRPPRRRDDDRPRRDYGDRPRPARFDRDGGEKRDFKPRGDRPKF